MIKKIINGYEHYECSRCGEETDEYDDYCQICGHSFDSIEEETVLNDNAKEDETMCLVIGARKSGAFTFTQLKKDITPRTLLDLPNFQGQRMMAEANPYEFYVFKTNKYPYLSQGIQINLNFESYDNFKTGNGYRIYFDKNHFSQFDINELKTYNFN